MIRYSNSFQKPEYNETVNFKIDSHSGFNVEKYPILQDIDVDKSIKNSYEISLNEKGFAIDEQGIEIINSGLIEYHEESRANLSKVGWRRINLSYVVNIYSSIKYRHGINYF
jgi:hypothetical protein